MAKKTIIHFFNSSLLPCPCKTLPLRTVHVSAIPRREIFKMRLVPPSRALTAAACLPENSYDRPVSGRPERCENNHESSLGHRLKSSCATAYATPTEAENSIGTVSAQSDRAFFMTGNPRLSGIIQSRFQKKMTARSAASRQVDCIRATNNHASQSAGIPIVFALRRFLAKTGHAFGAAHRFVFAECLFAPGPGFSLQKMLSGPRCKR